MKRTKYLIPIWVLCQMVLTLNAQEKLLLQSKLNTSNKDTIIFIDVNNDKNPDILEAW